MTRSCTVLAAAVVLGACGQGAPPSPGNVPSAPIQTDALAYTARPVSDGGGDPGQVGFTLVARFTNRADSAVYLARATPDQPRPDIRVVAGAGGASSAYDPVPDAVGHDRQIAVGPGETRADTFRLRGPTAWDGDTGVPFGLLEGEMRVAYRAQGCRGDGACPLPDSVALSNPFTVALPDGTSG